MDEYFGDTFENYNLLYEVATFEHFVNHDPQPRKCSEILNCDINKFMFICSQCDAEFENADAYQIHQTLEHQSENTQANFDLDTTYEKDLLDELLNHQDNAGTRLKEFYESVEKIIDMNDINGFMPSQETNCDNVCDYLLESNTLSSNSNNSSNKAEPMTLSYSDNSGNHVSPTYVLFDRERELSAEGNSSTSSHTATIPEIGGGQTKRKKKRTPGQCDVCNRFFNDTYNLRIHKMIHTGEMPFQCNDCGKGFRQFNKLKIHSIIHTNKKPFVCDLCGKGFRFRNYLAIHKRLHTGEKPYKCKLCDEHFHSLHNRRLHVKATHLQPEESFSCKFCGKVLSTKCYLQVHMKRHNNQRDFKCEDCEEAFFTVAQLKEHMLTHAAEKPHQCEICQVTFQRMTNYTQHVKTHFGVVNDYNKTFAQNAQLFASPMNVHGQ